MKRKSINSRKAIDNYVVGGLFDIFEKMKEKGYEERDGQIDMALDIAEAIRDGDNIIVEAGVGIGKSFAYLFPSMLYTKVSRTPVAVASSTIHLTDQLEEDVKNVENITGREVSAIVGKGQRNYFCEKRAKKYISSSLDKSDTIKNYVRDYPSTTIRLSNREWKKINVAKCTHNQCNYRFDCEFYNMRQGLNGFGKMAGDIIIVNQDLLIANYLKEDKTGRPFIDDRHEVVIIDEAHNLEEKARNALTITFYKEDAIDLITQAEKVNGVIYKELKNSIGEMYDAIQNHVKLHQTEEFEQSRSAFNGDYLNKYKHLTTSIESVYSRAQVIDMQQGRVSDELIENLDNLVTLFEGVFDPAQTNQIFWAEIINDKASICYAPDNISEKLNQLLFKRSKQFVLTSATLSAGSEDSEYSYLRNSIGLNNPVTSPSKPSPFPYDKNARIYLPDNISKYDKPDFVSELSEHILKLAIATNGRTLVLFTSKKEMADVYKFLKRDESHSFNIIMQSSKKEQETLKEFNDTKGILLATGTYWEGLNIEGSDLTSLIIARLPFPVPDPVIENKISKSGDPYNEVLLPEMLLKLRQGVGRLIRKDTDVGLLSILDYRLTKKSKYKYKYKILQSIPIQNQIDSIEEIKSFLGYSEVK